MYIITKSTPINFNSEVYQLPRYLIRIIKSLKKKVQCKIQFSPFLLTNMLCIKLCNKVLGLGLYNYFQPCLVEMVMDLNHAPGLELILGFACWGHHGGSKRLSKCKLFSVVSGFSLCSTFKIILLFWLLCSTMCHYSCESCSRGSCRKKTNLLPAWKFLVWCWKIVL